MSGIKTEVVVVNDVSYTLTTFDTEFAFEMFLELAKHLSDPIKAVFSGLIEGDNIDKADSAFLENLAPALKSLEPKELTLLVKKLLTYNANCRLTDKKVAVKMSDFSGDLMSMLCVAKEIIKFNYSEFFLNFRTILPGGE
jgi:hypothetical protein